MRRVSFLNATGFLVLSWMAWAGCSEQTPERPAKARAALLPQVSTPFYVETYPEVAPADDAELKWACGTEQCVAAFARAIEGVGFSFYARVNPAGTPIDAPPMRFPDDFGVAAIGARGTEFLVSGIRDIAWHQTEPRSYRIAADGTLSDVTASIPEGATLIVGASDRWLIAYYDQSGTLMVRLLDSTLATVGQDRALPFTSLDPLQVTAGANQFLVHVPGKAVRVRALDGVLLDTSPIEYSRYNNGEARAAFRDGTFQLVWGSGQNLYGSRIRASDGVALDPDDTFNQVSGARLLCSNCANDGPYGQVGSWDIGDTGNGLLVTWNHSTASSVPNRLVGARVDVATGERTNGVTNAVEFDIAGLGGYTEHRLHLTPTWGLLHSRFNWARGLTYQAGSPPAVQVTVKKSVAAQSEPRKDAAVVYGGSQFLVVWHRGDVNYATRIDASTGAYLDSPPTHLGIGNAVTLGWTGTHFLVGSIEGGFVRVVRLDSNGDVVSGTGIPVTSSSTTSNSHLRIVNNGSTSLVTWCQNRGGYRTLYGARLDASANVLDTEPVILAGNAYCEDYAVLADTTPAADRRTFLIAYQASDQAFQTHIFTRRFRAASGVLIEPPIDLGIGSDVWGASDGTSMFITFRDGVLGETYGNHIAGQLDPIDGTWVGALTSPNWWNQQVRMLQTWFDGISYDALTWSPQLLDAHAVRRLTPSLQHLDPSSPAEGTLTVRGRSICRPVAATNGAGKSLIVDCEADPVHLGVAIRGRWFEHDGELAPPTGVGGAGGDDNGDAGAGGGGDGGAASSSGGRGGTGATAGNGGTPNTGETNAKGGSTGVGGSDLGGAGSSGGGHNTGGAGGAANEAGAGGAISTGGSDAGGPAGGGAGASTTGGKHSGGRGGTSGQGGSGATGQGEGESCSCRQAGRGGSSTSAILLALVALASVRRVRRIRVVNFGKD